MIYRKLMQAAGAGGPQTLISDIVFVGSASKSFAAATNLLGLTALSGGIDTQPSPGDIVIFFYGVSSSGQAPVLGVPGYTELAPVAFNNRAFEASLFGGYKFMGATPDTTVGFTVDGISTGASARAVFAFVFRNVDNGTPLSADTRVREIGTTINPLSITPAVANSLVIASGMIASNTSGTGLTSPDLTNFVAQNTSDTDSITAGTGFVIASTTFDPGLFTGGPTTSTDNAAASFTAAFRPATYPKAAEIELSLENPSWVGIDGVLRFLRPDGTDALASATWVPGSPTNGFDSISPGEFTTNSDYNSVDPRTGLHWSDSASSGGIKIFFKPAETEAFAAVELKIRNEGTYGIPTPRIFLDGVEENVSGLLGDATLRKTTILY